MQVFVTGGTGLVGSRLVRKLMARGDGVAVLTRRYAHARQQFGTNFMPVEGDPSKPGEWMDHAATADAVINLAGENVFARRWHPEFKQLLADSRVRSTENVAVALGRAPYRADGQPKVLVNASAVGYYGPHGDEELTEDSPPGSDFLADVAVRWETAALATQAAGPRVAIVRVGVVLDPEGGALARLLTPFKLFSGGPVAGGRQWMSWIHHEDLTDLFLFALDHPEAAGPFNGTAPNPVTNRNFARALGRALHRPAFVPTPAFALRLAFGEVAQVVISGQRALPERALHLGYEFRFPTLDAALADLLRR